MGQQADWGRPIPDVAATIAEVKQGDGERDWFTQPEISVSKVQEILLTELFDVSAL